LPQLICNHPQTPMKMKTLTSRLAILATLAVFTTSPAFSAVTLYSTVFSNVSSDTSINTLGWTAYRSNGTNLTNSTSDPFRVINGSGVFIGSNDTSAHGYAMISDAPTISLADYQNDLTISFTHRDTDDGTQNPTTMGWRVFLTVGSTIYASNFFSRSTVDTTQNVLVSDAIWRVWTGETDLTNGFAFGDSAFSATPTTISGTISNIGILAIDGPSNNDRLRLLNFSISGTVIPEPSTALLGGLGMLCLLRRRR